jgi:rhodanese-related sulfurtransferase
MPGDRGIVHLTREEIAHRRCGDESIILIDVLPHEHFLRLHLPGAINIPLAVLRDLAPQLFSPDDSLVTYCTNPQCMLSKTAARVLQQLGFQHVAVYPGGLEDWIGAGLPIVEAPPQAA